jgi:hypothetical protein
MVHLLVRSSPPAAGSPSHHTALLLDSPSLSVAMSRPYAKILSEHTGKSLADSGQKAAWTTRTVFYRNQQRRRGGDHRRAKKQIQCWAECDLRDLIWLLLLACVAASGLSVGVFYVLVQPPQRQEAFISSPLSTRTTTATHDTIQHHHHHSYNLSSTLTALEVNGTDPVEQSNNEVAVFYNVFASNNPFDITATDVRPIVREQLEQIAASFSIPSTDSPSAPTIYYTTIGKNSDEAIIRACSALDLTCRHLQHFSVASETATLTRLHEYCHKYPRHTVVYLHNKGSLHHSASQDRWRRALTQSATSSDCRTGIVAAPFQCNVCGLLFQPLPASHYPGNMWSATCRYVRQLLPPHEYHALRPAVDEWIRREQNAFLFRPEAHFVGKKRYIAEHWIGSHPSLRPCDVSTSPNLDDWTRDGSSSSSSSVYPRPALRLQRAPRTALDDPRWIFYRYLYRNETLVQPDLRLRDYFLLRGILYKWMVFYQTVADADSWVWQWYPDGPEWWAALLAQDDDPLRAIQVMVNATGSAAIVQPGRTLTQQMLQAGSTALDWMNPWNGGNNNNGAIVYDPF